MQRHELNPVSLFFGLLFTGLGVIFLLDRSALLTRLRWAWPVLLVVLGLALLTTARSRAQQSTAGGGAVPPAPGQRPAPGTLPPAPAEGPHTPTEPLGEPGGPTRRL